MERKEGARRQACKRQCIAGGRTGQADRQAEDRQTGELGRLGRLSS